MTTTPPGSPGASAKADQPLFRTTLTPRASRESRPRVSSAIEAKNFKFGYTPSKMVLDGLTISFERKAVTAIIGPSGCGKSTFLRSMNRMHDLIPGATYGGELMLEGQSILGSKVDLVTLRQRVGMVFQRPNPFPKSIYENVAYGPALNRLVPKREIPDLVERCLRQAALWDEVKDRLNDDGASLSGGQQQRLCIARALGNRPEVLLMDEPCSALDPIATQKVEELIFQLKEDYTIVIVTHNMQQAARVSDYTAFMDRGGLVEFDETEKVFTSPAHERTEAYITGRFG